MLAVALFYFSRLGLVSVSYLSSRRVGSQLRSAEEPYLTFDSISKALAPNLWALKEREENTKMVTPFRNMARSVTSLAARWPVHSLAHELAASPEATSRLPSFPPPKDA